MIWQISQNLRYFSAVLYIILSLFCFYLFVFHNCNIPARGRVGGRISFQPCDHGTGGIYWVLKCMTSRVNNKIITFIAVILKFTTLNIQPTVFYGPMLLGKRFPERHSWCLLRQAMGLFHLSHRQPTGYRVHPSLYFTVLKLKFLENWFILTSITGKCQSFSFFPK